MSDTTDQGSQALRGELWPRFDAYELDDGLIRPKAGAKVEWYDPWLAEEKRRTEGGGESPRNSLLRIVDRILEPSLPANVRDDSPWSERALRELLAGDHPLMEGLGRKVRGDLLGWCAQNGLLGLLHHQLLEVILPPVLLGPYKRADSDVRPQSGDTRFWTKQDYLRAEATGWYRSFLLGKARVSADAQKGQPVPAARWSKHVKPPRGTYHGITDGAVSTEPLPGRWTRFFGSLPLEETIAGLSSEEGWRSYGEPLEDFVAVAGAISLALRQVALIRESGAPTKAALTEFQYWCYDESVRLVATVASVAVPAPYIDDHLSPRPRWSSRSLLGSLAMMTLLDLYGGYAVIVCKNCGTVFLSRAPQAKFCTTRCRFTYHKREWRKSQSVEGDAT